VERNDAKIEEDPPRNARLLVAEIDRNLYDLAAGRSGRVREHLSSVHLPTDLGE